MIDNLAQLFSESRAGNQAAENILYRLTASRLRRLARALMKGERQGHTLQPTALVSEFFLRARGLKWRIRDDEDFFRLSARVMKQVLVDHARHRRARRRAAPEDLHQLLASRASSRLSPDLRIAVDAALDQLRAVDAVAAATVWQHCVEGATFDELAQLQRRDVWRVRADCDYGLRWMAGRLE